MPACYATEGLLVAALTESGDDAVATATGFVWATAIIMTPVSVLSVSVLSGSFIPISEAISGFGWAFASIGSVSAVSTMLLMLAIRTTGAVFSSQVGYANTAGGIIWSILLLNEPMSSWVWAAMACMISGVVLVMPKQKGL